MTNFFSKAAMMLGVVSYAMSDGTDLIESSGEKKYKEKHKSPDEATSLKAYRKHRKAKRRMARKSRRANRA